MTIVLFDGKRIDCWKIEPSIKQGYIVIDEEYSIALIDVRCIVPKK